MDQQLTAQNILEITLKIRHKLVFPFPLSRIFLCNNVTLGYHSGGEGREEGGDSFHYTGLDSPASKGFREIPPVIVFSAQSSIHVDLPS